jgi:hypothetical protein
MECSMSKSIEDSDTSCRQIQNNHGESWEEEVLSGIWHTHTHTHAYTHTHMHKRTHKHTHKQKNTLSLSALPDISYINLLAPEFYI